jgi:hypothetical protein
MRGARAPAISSIRVRYLKRFDPVIEQPRAPPLRIAVILVVG